MMIKLRVSILFLIMVLSIKSIAQKDMPIDTLNSRDGSKPLVLYISGDGGFNSFSRSFAQQWNSRGYPVISLDSRSYFWSSRKPENAAADIAGLLRQYMARWRRG